METSLRMSLGPFTGKAKPMSCWVVPTIAAELWGVSLDHVLGQVGEGSVRSKTEHGFMLVDVAPFSEVFRSPRWVGPRPRIQTFTVLTPDEYDALHGTPLSVADDDRERDDDRDHDHDDGAGHEPQEEAEHHEISDAVSHDAPHEVPLPVREEVREVVREVVREEVSVVVEDPEAGPDPNDEPDDGKPLRWREGRNRAARMRRRPPGV